MRTIILRTAQPCSGTLCTHCRLVEHALRRALGLQGFPVPRHRDGRSQEMFVSKALSVGIEHECDERVLFADGHVRLEVDGRRVDLPKGPSLPVLEAIFQGLLHAET